jgi:hypothetical protein
MTRNEYNNPLDILRATVNRLIAEGAPIITEQPAAPRETIPAYVTAAAHRYARLNGYPVLVTHDGGCYQMNTPEGYAEHVRLSALTDMPTAPAIATVCAP